MVNKMAQKKSRRKTTKKKTGKEKMEEKELKIKEGDFVLIDYIGKVKDSGEVFDTTIEEEAKKADIYNERTKYGPMLVIVGERWVVEGLDKSLLNKKEGEEYIVEVPPEEGFGRRDSKKIVTTTIRKLRKAGYEGDLAPGVVLNVNGAPAIVRAVVSGRVMLDFNPPLAGKTLVYNVWIRKVIRDRKEKIVSLVERHLKQDMDGITVDEKNGKIIIDFGDKTIAKPELHLHKKEIADDLMKYIDGVTEIMFTEHIKREESKEEEKLQQEISQDQSGNQADQ